jgi:hypothetical protein
MNLLSCRICGEKTLPYGSANVLGKYMVQYIECSSCGLVQTEDPYWLKEAYSDAITSTDVGLVSRNFHNARVAASVIRLTVGREGHFLDCGGGYGLFVRLMRDRGYDFRWQDKYATNLFAKGFEANGVAGSRFTLVTMFEMIEHLVDPVAELQQICAQTDHLLFSTLLLPPGSPSPDSWWYFNPDHGQHISFFTAKALGAAARRLGRHFCTDGRSYHYIGTRKLNPFLFQLAVGRAGRFLADLLDSRRSLMQKGVASRTCILRVSGPGAAGDCA